MLLETVLALNKKLNSINESPEIVASGFKVTVLTGEVYREHIANKERNGVEIKYPIIVMHEGNQMEFDVRRFSNDTVKQQYKKVVNDKGETNYYCDVYNPLLPYNLNYRIEVICQKRIQLDMIILWVLKNIQSRDYLEVKYKDVENKECLYDAIVKRSNIVNADEGTSSTLYRRIFEMNISTLIDNTLKESVIQVIGTKFIMENISNVKE